MNRKFLLITGLLAGSALHNAQAQSGPELTFIPVSQTIGLNDGTSVEAVITGLSSAGQILSSFDVSVDFNSAILGFVSGTAGTNFGDVSYVDAPTLSGSTISWDLASSSVDTILQGLQGDTVVLGTLTFSGLNDGTSALTYSYSDLTGLNSQAFDFSLGQGSITVTSGNNGTAPEPATLGLMSLGAFGLLRGKRKAHLAAI